MKVWELSKVAAHYQDEAAVILMAEHEASIFLYNTAAKAGALSPQVILPDY